MLNHPVLIVNPRSGEGRAAAIDLAGAAQKLGIETVTMQPGDDLASLASSIVDQGSDHLMMAGGDGSLATVAEIAIARGVPFSCVPLGTRNHFAMDLGLDRRNPLRSLDAAFDGLERLIDVGIVAGQVFLNNASFGLYPRAIADPEYRSHRARSMADAAVDTARDLETQTTLTLPDGRVVADVEVLLTSNNPYRFIGPPRLRQTPRSRHRHAGDHPCRPSIAAETRACRLHTVGDPEAHRSRRSCQHPGRRRRRAENVPGSNRGNACAEVAAGSRPETDPIEESQGVDRATQRARHRPFERPAHLAQPR